MTFLGIVTYLRHSTVPLAAELTENQFFDLINVTYGPERLLQSIAFNKKFSIEVIDRLESNGKRMAVFRVLAADLGSETTILLRTPEIFHKSNIDTTRWDIDWTYLPAGSYYQAMVASMFKSGAVAFTLKSEANVLCIGLGGGSINGFLHHVFPKMHITVVESEPRMVLIAKRWFGLQLDDRHRLEVNDGLKFIADRARSGSTYDAILLDACENDTTAKNLCPLEGFLNETIIKDLVLLTSDRGVLILNAISFVYPKEQVRQRLLSRFVKHFKYCYVDDMDYWLNLVLSCSQRPRNVDHIDVFKFVNATLI